MDCELCERAPDDTLVILPIKKADGALITLACLKCAENSSAYCKKHERPHLGFEDDDTTACMFCIEETVDEKRSMEVDIFNTFQHELPTEEFNSLLEWAALSASITGNSEATCILRAIITKALRLNQSIEEVVEKVIKTEAVDFILPYTGASV